MNNPQEHATERHEYRKLLNEFYEQNRDMVSSDDYEKAKEDPEYFRSLILKVTKLYQSIGKELLLKDRNYHVWEKQFKRQKQGGD